MDELERKKKTGMVIRGIRKMLFLEEKQPTCVC